MYFCLLVVLTSLTSLCTNLYGLIDLEDLAQGFVLETKKIEIPGYPKAFNPSIVQWKGKVLMTFREIPGPKPFFTSYLGIVYLDHNFNAISTPQILEIRDKNSPIPSRIDDARLITIGETLFLVFSDNEEIQISKKGFRVHIATLTESDGFFTVHNIECLCDFEGESPLLREKNWTPFDYKGNLLLAYSINPHRILHPLLGTGACETFCTSEMNFQWEWGTMRGGTTGIVEGEEYLTFFHSVKKMATINSQGREVPHYFMGAYTYSLHSPFNIQRISPEPIVGYGFYDGGVQTPYWGSKKVIFPCGHMADEDYIWVSYGKQDKEAWVMKLDKKAVLNSLVSVY